MPCPHCRSTSTRERAARTQLGYRTFACRTCRRSFNERTGTPFNQLTFPSEIVLQIVLWRLRYTLSLRDLAEMFLERGFVFTHEALREWEARFAPLLAEKLRAKRHGQADSSWYVDETYLKVNGQWCYLYRAIDRDSNLVDSMLSQTRDMHAAQRFFRQARVVAGQAPARVTTDGHSAYPRAIRESLGRKSSTVVTSISTTAWSKTTAGSNSATIPCAGSGAVNRQPISAEPSRNCDSSNGIGEHGRRRGHSPNGGNG